MSDINDTSTHDDMRVEAEDASSHDSANTTVGQQEFGSIAVWGLNHTMNATVPIASLHWRGEVHDDSMNSHKLYTITVTGSFVVRTWGRIAGYGRKGTQNCIVEEFDTEEQAIHSAETQIHKKITHGYVAVEVSA